MPDFDVYPKATLAESTWLYLVKVNGTRFTHQVPAGVTAEVPLPLLKLAFELTTGATDTAQDVDDAMWLDTAQGGPTNGETLWESWQTLAESIIAGLTSPYTAADFQAEWTQQNTARIRTAARRILINGRGWSVGAVHQHEGDGSVLEE